MINTPEHINIFIAYTPEDRSFVEELEVHLSVLERLGMVDKIWYDGLVEAGMDWEKTVLNALANADIILLLVSADFIASDFCYQKEMQQAIKLHEEGKVQTVPIIVRPCLWNNTPFGSLKTLPANGIPVASKKWAHVDEPYVEITEELEKIIVRLKQKVEGGNTKKSNAQFKQSVAEAQAFFAKGKWLEALVKYQNALLFADQQSAEEVKLIHQKMDQCKNENYFQRNFIRGEKAYQEHRFSDAQAAFAQALIFKPHHEEALRLKLAAEFGKNERERNVKTTKEKPTSEVNKFFQINLFGFEIFKIVIAMSVFGLVAITALRVFKTTAPNYIVSVESGQVTYLNANGKEVLKTPYVDGKNFSNGIAAVKNKDGKWGFIDEKNKTAIDFKYDGAWPHSKEGLAYVRKNGQCGFVNEKGKEVIPLTYLDAASFSEGLAMVKKGERDFAFINKFGKEVIANLEGVVTKQFKNGEAVVIRKGRKITIDKKGKCIEGCDRSKSIQLKNDQRLKAIQQLKQESKNLREQGEYDRALMKLQELKTLNLSKEETRAVENQLDLIHRKLNEK